MARRRAPRLVDDRHRVALTPDARRALGVSPGDYVEFEVTGDGDVRLHALVVQRAPRSAGTEPGLAPEGAKAPPAPPTLLAAPGTVIYPPRVAGSVQSLRSPAGPAGAD